MNHVVTLESATLPLPWYVPDPFKCHGLGFREFSRVLDIVPDAVNDFPELPLDVLGRVNRIEPTTIFDPPEIAALHVRTELTVAGDFGDIFQCPARSGEFHGCAGVLAVKIHRVT
jgi:hypothetical protein